MNDNDFKFVFEASLAREERHIKRLIIALIITIVLLFTTNLAWLMTTSKYDVTDEVITTASQDGDNNIVGGGDINYGTTSGYDNEAQDEN